MEEKEQSNIKNNINSANVGLNMDLSVNQIKPGTLTYALNASVENFDANSINYQNESSNEFCLQFPQDYILIGSHFIQEQNKQIFFLSNPVTGDSEIGYMINNNCKYITFLNAKCLNFNVQYPIQKVVHKITNCSVEIYWTDGFNPRRYLDLDENKLPYKLTDNSELCNPTYTKEIDCNQLKLQPNFSIPIVEIQEVITGGELTAGTVQFAVQYSDVVGNPFTSFYSVTNPVPIADIQITTPNFNYEVGKSVVLYINNLDTSGQFNYFNLAVIKTINAVSSVELVGTYFINNVKEKITYSGQNKTQINLSILDIFEKQPYYDLAEDVTVAQDVLIWKGLTSIDRVNYQKIANQISLKWETYRIPANENYSNEINSLNFRGYLRDEVYPFEICFILKNGKQTDGFHIPGRVKNSNENFPDVPDTNPDFIGHPDYYDSFGVGYSPYWKIYNTGKQKETSPLYNPNDENYKGPYQSGEFAYWESEEIYPCNEEVWGDLANKPIRHHKFPDVLISPIFETKTFSTLEDIKMGNRAIYPIGVKVDVDQIKALIKNSQLSESQKDDIVGFKILRGDRSTNKSIIGKGILRNVGEYKREEQSFYFPNYPYNDLEEDPFLNQQNNAYIDICKAYVITCTNTGRYEFTDCNTNKLVKKSIKAGEVLNICSCTFPSFIDGGQGKVCFGDTDIYKISGGFFMLVRWINQCNNPDWDVVSDSTYVSVPKGGGAPVVEDYAFGDPKVTYIKTIYSELSCSIETPLNSIKNKEYLKYRQIFNSPETSFGQPFLGNVLKLENVIFGKGKDHFVEVKNNARYRLLSKEAQEDALKSCFTIAAGNVAAIFAGYQAYLTIYINGITRKNYAYSYNSIADYNYTAPIENNINNKQRQLELKSYLIPGVQNVGDDKNINNFQRESSVFLKTLEKRNNNSVSSLLYPDKVPTMLTTSGTSIISDKSRRTISSSERCNAPGEEKDISVVSYYASLKNINNSQWGQIYSYTTIDTGFQYIFNVSDQQTLFGGDTFISRFSFKTKLPFFIDNRVGAPDDSDIFYDDLGNVAYPKYWHSARTILSSYGSLTNIISIKAHIFDCPNNPELISSTNSSSNSTNRTYYDGYFYLFAYGIPSFYCETSYNLDLRQAFNNKEGDFWPHVSSGIPDDWLQEKFVSIANDNTYYYNTTYSKQNKENTFTHLPIDYNNNLCNTYYPFRAIYSEPQTIDADNRINNWLIYRPISYFDFPQNYGKLISLDGIENKSILARFENKTLKYNNLLTIDTSNPQAAYIGNSNLFKGAPPIDFAETDLGFVGSQHKFLLKIPQGQVTVDSKRGQVFLLQGTEVKDLSAFGSGMNRFLTDNLSFEISKYYPNINIDNNFNGIGLHGVYDSKFDRIIITKLDYTPLDNNIKYDKEKDEFYIEEIEYIDILPTTTTTTTII